MSKPRRPNILFAIADDASHMSAYGHRFVHTPHFDRVARDGALFRRAYTCNPKCAPSRAAILTGKQTWQLGEACNHFGIFPAKFRVYPDLLEEVGYHVGFTGKGWAPGDFKTGGFTRNPAGPEYSRHTLSPPTSTISNKDYAANFEAFLADRPEGAPFCFWYGGHEPHRPYEDGQGRQAGKSIDAVDVPGYLPTDDVVRSDLLDYAVETEWFDRHLGLMLARLERIGELGNTLVVVTSDNGMPFPRVKGQMYEADFRLPLAMMWPGVCRPGRVVDDLVSFIDLAPTFLEAANIKPPDDITGRSLLNILQSDNSGWIDPTRDRVFMGKERHDLGREGDRGYPVRCIRTKEFLYVRNFAPDRWPAGNPETGFTNIDSSPTKKLILEQHERGQDRYYALAMGKRAAEELFKVEQDPDCLHNLADDPDYSQIKAELWAELKATLERQGDPRMADQGNVFDTYEYVGEDSHSWKAYIEGRWQPQRY